jgi:hypothetical protein
MTEGTNEKKIESKEQDTFDKAAEKAKKHNERYAYMGFNEVPRPTYDLFNELAEKEFGGHRGFCLKALMDQMVVQRDAVSELRMDEFEERINIIERVIVQQNVARDFEKDKVDSESKRQTIGGRVI